MVVAEVVKARVVVTESIFSAERVNGCVYPQHVVIETNRPDLKTDLMLGQVKL